MAREILQQSFRVGIYARVSTPDGKGQSPEVQLRELREHCECRGWQMVGEYVDRMTGSKDSRPELNRLMADAHKRRFDVVIVWKFDRFARSVSHLLRALETFKALGIEFVSFSEQLDTSTPAGKLVFTVLGAVAELERSLIVERVRAGMRNARAKGKRIGRPPLVQLTMERRIAIAYCYANEKTSLRSLAKRFGTSLGTVQRCVGVRPTAASEGTIPLSS
jgi:DNA invertase Pin-like site-specific DNA recombinase